MAWVRNNLHVIDDPRYWVIGGLFERRRVRDHVRGGRPSRVENVMYISGEPYPGSEQADNVTQTIYGGSQAAFDASKPVNIFAANPGAYAGMTAAFTAGGDDPDYEQAAETVSPAAKAAGMAVTYDVIPGAGHTGDALTAGLENTVGKM